MSSELKITPEIHRKLAVDLFNFTWTLINKDHRTQMDVDEMVHAAHASLYHWSKIGTPLNFARGEWQVSRVYAVLGRHESARYHAQRCLNLCQENGIGDFDLAFAYEALARAAAAGSSWVESAHFLELAKQAAEHILEDDDRQLLVNDLKTIPGYQD